MPYDRRLPRILHVLLHLEKMEQPATSNQIGEMLTTDAAFVRRTMAGLRDRGWVTSSQGRGGGWVLVVPLSKISILDLYEALGAPALFALAGSEDAPRCLMERAANVVVGEALAAAEASFRRSLEQVTVADIAQDFEGRMKESGRSGWVPPSELDGGCTEEPED